LGVLLPRKKNNPTSIRYGKAISAILSALMPYYGESKTEVVKSIIRDWFKLETVKKQLIELDNQKLINLSKIEKELKNQYSS